MGKVQSLFIVGAPTYKLRYTYVPRFKCRTSSICRLFAFKVLTRQFVKRKISTNIHLVNTGTPSSQRYTLWCSVSLAYLHTHAQANEQKARHQSYAYLHHRRDSDCSIRNDYVHAQGNSKLVLNLASIWDPPRHEKVHPWHTPTEHNRDPLCGPFLESI